MGEKVEGREAGMSESVEILVADGGEVLPLNTAIAANRILIATVDSDGVAS